MPLTKADFIHYLNCPHSLWLQKNVPEDFPEGEVTAFLKKLAQDGMCVEGPTMLSHILAGAGEPAVGDRMRMKPTNIGGRVLPPFETISEGGDDE